MSEERNVMYFFFKTMDGKETNLPAHVVKSAEPREGRLFVETTDKEVSYAPLISNLFTWGWSRWAIDDDTDLSFVAMNRLPGD